MAADERVGILLEAKNKASSVIGQVKNDLSDLGKGAGGIDSITSSLAGLGKAAGLVGLALSAIEVGETVVELAQLGAQAERLETSFDTLTKQAGISSDGLLSALQRASGGTIANTELMLSSNRALALGVADSTEEIAQLMEVAIARGKALGLSAQQAFSDLVTGIGRMSPLILDNLGIITGGEKVFEDYARSIGRSASSLTDMERKQALVNKVIAESRDLVTANAAAGQDAAAGFERVAASFANLKTDLGDLFGPAIAAIADKLAVAVDAAAGAVREFGDAGKASVEEQKTRLVEVREQYERLKSAIASADFSQPAFLPPDLQQFSSAADAARTLGLLEKELTAAHNGYLEALVKAYPAQAQAAEAMNRTSIEAQALMQASGAVATSMLNQQSAAANLNASFNLLAGTYDALIERAQILSGVTGALGSIASQVVNASDAKTGIAFFNDITEATERQIKAWQDTGFSQKEITNVLLPAYQQEVRRSAEETYNFGQAATRANKLAAQSLKEVNQEYNNLQSKVGGVLSGALNDIGGVDLDSILPRQDAVNEDARRLADVAVKGFDSPWAEYFRTKFPELFAELTAGGDVKVAAAQILRDFQDGLRPELLDKDRAKALVRRAILGEQNTKALVDEISKELAAELGISLAEAQRSATQALGGSLAQSATGKENTTKVTVVPEIDRSQLGSQQLDLSARVTTLSYADSVLTRIDLSATVTTVALAEGIALPLPQTSLTISSILMAEGVQPPSPVISGGMTIVDVGLRSDVQIPDVEIVGNVLVTPPDTSTITDKALILSAEVAVVTLPPALELPVVRSGMEIDSIAIAEGTTPPAPAITSDMTITSVALSPDAVLPTVELSATVAIAQPDISDVEAVQPKLNALVSIDWLSVSNAVAPDTLIERLRLVLPATIDWQSVDTETAKQGLLQRLTLPILPNVSFDEFDSETPLGFLQSQLTPTVIPSVDYLSVPQEELAAAGFWIAAGIQTGIVTFNLGGAIVAELVKAQSALTSNGIVSGQTWGAGFNAGASEYINGIVGTVVSLALAQLSRSATRTGAQ